MVSIFGPSGRQPGYGGSSAGAADANLVVSLVFDGDPGRTNELVDAHRPEASAACRLRDGARSRGDVRAVVAGVERVRVDVLVEDPLAHVPGEIRVAPLPVTLRLRPDDDDPGRASVRGVRR